MWWYSTISMLSLELLLTNGNGDILSISGILSYIWLIFSI